jgi:hypothetical protein
MKYHIVFFERHMDGQTNAVPDSSAYVNLNSFKTSKEAYEEACCACENVNKHWIGRDDDVLLEFRIARS